MSICASQFRSGRTGPHPDPLPEYRERGQSRGAATRSGLTFAELVIGMMVTALVAAAVAAVLTSVSQGWQNSREIETQTSLSSQGMSRINKTIRTVRQIGAIRAGGINSSPGQPAAALVWRGDFNEDGKIQFSELALLEHDPSGDADFEIPSNALVWWQVEYPSNWSDEEKAADDSIVSDASFYNDSEIDAFRTNFTTLIQPTVMALEVSAVQLARVDSQSTLRPALEYVLKFQDSQDSNITQIKYGRTTLRGPGALAAGYP